MPAINLVVDLSPEQIDGINALVKGGHCQSKSSLASMAIAFYLRRDDLVELLKEEREQLDRGGDEQLDRGGDEQLDRGGDGGAWREGSSG